MDVWATVVLILAGGLGGLAQALLAEKGRLKVPTWDAAAREVDFGFLADLLVGMIGATAALVVGLAVLNQQFFAPVGAAATPGSPAGPLLDVPSWIRFMSFGALTGFGSRRLLPALSDKITNAITQEVNKNVQPIEQRMMRQAEQLKQQTESTAEVLQSSIAGVTTAAEMTARGVGAPSLADLVKEYDAIKEPDFRKRLASKNQIASHMGALVLREGDQRATIQSHLGAGASEGWVLALAVQIGASPKLGDGSLLLNVAKNLQRLHVMYRVVSTFYRLKMTKLLSDEETRAAVALIESYLPKADNDLRRNIQSTVAYLQSGK